MGFKLTDTINYKDFDYIDGSVSSNIEGTQPYFDSSRNRIVWNVSKSLGLKFGQTFNGEWPTITFRIKLKDSWRSARNNYINTNNINSPYSTNDGDNATQLEVDSDVIIEVPSPWLPKEPVPVTDVDYIVEEYLISADANQIIKKINKKSSKTYTGSDGDKITVTKPSRSYEYVGLKPNGRGWNVGSSVTVSEFVSGRIDTTRTEYTFTLDTDSSTQYVQFFFVEYEQPTYETYSLKLEYVDDSGANSKKYIPTTGSYTFTSEDMANGNLPSAITLYQSTWGEIDDYEITNPSAYFGSGWKDLTYDKTKTQLNGKLYAENRFNLKKDNVITFHYVKPTPPPEEEVPYIVRTYLVNNINGVMKSPVLLNTDTRNGKKDAMVSVVKPSLTYDYIGLNANTGSKFYVGNCDYNTFISTNSISEGTQEYSFVLKSDKTQYIDYFFMKKAISGPQPIVYTYDTYLIKVKDDMINSIDHLKEYSGTANEGDSVIVQCPTNEYEYVGYRTDGQIPDGEGLTFDVYKQSYITNYSKKYSFTMNRDVTITLDFFYVLKETTEITVPDPGPDPDQGEVIFNFIYVDDSQDEKVLKTNNNAVTKAKEEITDQVYKNIVNEYTLLANDLPGKKTSSDPYEEIAYVQNPYKISPLNYNGEDVVTIFYHYKCTINEYGEADIYYYRPLDGTRTQYELFKAPPENPVSTGKQKAGTDIEVNKRTYPGYTFDFWNNGDGTDFTTRKTGTPKITKGKTRVNLYYIGAKLEDPELIPDGEVNQLDNKDKNSVVLDDVFTIKIKVDKPNLAAQAQASINIKFPFDVFKNNPSDNKAVLVPKDTWIEAYKYGEEKKEILVTYRIPSYVKEQKYDGSNGTGKTIIELRYPDDGYKDTNSKLEINVIGRVYDFTVTQLAGDTIWQNSLFGGNNVGLEYKADTLPIGQRQINIENDKSTQLYSGKAAGQLLTQPATYKYGIKLGSSFLFSIKTKGLKSDNIVIEPRVVYYDANGIKKDVTLTYTENGKEVQFLKNDIIQMTNKLSTRLNASPRLNTEVSQEINRANTLRSTYGDNPIGADNKGFISNVNAYSKFIIAESEFGTTQKLESIPNALRLPYVNYLAGLRPELRLVGSDKRVLNSIESMTGNKLNNFIKYDSLSYYKSQIGSNVTDDQIVNSLGHWYADYRLPATLKATDGGKAIKDGYIVVYFRIYTTDKDGNIYLRYEKQNLGDAKESFNQWTLENGNSSKSANMPLLLTQTSPANDKNVQYTSDKAWFPVAIYGLERLDQDVSIVH
jgi:hypothetical protein